jgi:hypothetical protein
MIFIYLPNAVHSRQGSRRVYWAVLYVGVLPEGGARIYSPGALSPPSVDLLLYVYLHTVCA